MHRKSGPLLNFIDPYGHGPGGQMTMEDMPKFAEMFAK